MVTLTIWLEIVLDITDISGIIHASRAGYEITNIVITDDNTLQFVKKIESRVSPVSQWELIEWATVLSGQMMGRVSRVTTSFDGHIVWDVTYNEETEKYEYSHGND